MEQKCDCRRRQQKKIFHKTVRLRDDFTVITSIPIRELVNGAGRTTTAATATSDQWSRHVRSISVSGEFFIPVTANEFEKVH